jgi:hypothetical protein
VFDQMSVRADRRRTARFIARRVRASVGADAQDRYGCPSLLYEQTYVCSPFDRTE